MLKEILYKIKENNYKPKDNQVEELLPQLLENIGHVDNSLRDDLIYTTLATWIVEGDVNDEQKSHIFEYCLENLNYELGELDTDSVFVRSFSVLQLSVLYYAHNKNAFLTNEQIFKGYKSILTYMSREQDLRGYVSGKGWAHAIAHTADALKFMSECETINTELLEGMLMAIKDKMMIDNYVYVNDEDERAVSAVVRIMKRLSEETMLIWIDGFSSIKRKGILPDDLIAQLNTKNFLRSLYFRIEPSKLKEKVDRLLIDSNRYK